MEKRVLRQNYEKLLNSGMFWDGKIPLREVFLMNCLQDESSHPELSGEWEKDREVWEKICDLKNNTSLMEIDSFTDYRGNAINKGDTYFWIDSNLNLMEDVFNSDIKGTHQFKSKGFAEDFIIRNIPIISIQDIVDHYFGRIAIVDLERIVKQKLSRKTQTS